LLALIQGFNSSAPKPLLTDPGAALVVFGFFDLLPAIRGNRFDEARPGFPDPRLLFWHIIVNMHVSATSINTSINNDRRFRLSAIFAPTDRK
jgi:hypothetical protein